MKNITEMCNEVLSSMPTETRFNREDANRIKQYRQILMDLQQTVVKGFYDVLYKNPGTMTIMQKVDRSKCELMLGAWWHKTVNSQFNEQYWKWQVFVGLVHVKHQVNNAMMIAMWGWLIEALRLELKTKLPDEEVEVVMASFCRLATTIQALIAESYFHNYLEAIENATGFKGRLIIKMVNLQIDDMMQRKSDCLSLAI